MTGPGRHEADAVSDTEMTTVRRRIKGSRGSAP